MTTKRTLKPKDNTLEQSVALQTTLRGWDLTHSMWTAEPIYYFSKYVLNTYPMPGTWEREMNDPAPTVALTL